MSANRIFMGAFLAIAPAPALAATDILDFSTTIEPTVSTFDASFFVDGNPALGGFSLQLQPMDYTVVGTLSGQIYRDAATEVVTAVDQQTAELALVRPDAEQNTFGFGGTVGEGPTVEVTGEITDPTITQAAPTGPRPVNSPFDAMIGFVNGGTASVEAALVTFFGTLPPVTIFDGDLAAQNVGFSVPLTGEITDLGGDMFTLSYTFDGVIELLPLPAIFGGGTANLSVETSLATPEFLATLASGGGGGTTVIPLPLPVLSLGAGLAALALLRRRTSA